MKSRLIILFQFVILTAYSQNEQINVTTRIIESKFVMLNGIEQWITIKGDSTKPIVLFIHGGPGSSLCPYADAIYSKWEKDFILVQWDQRGTARTYGHNAPEALTPAYIRSNPLTVKQMTSDGIELAKYLIKHLGKQKIILVGTSWGTVLATNMVLENPELFYAYIGHSQIVNPSDANLYAYNKVFKIAQNSRDQKSLDILNSIGKPPYDTAKSLGSLMRIIKKYQQMKSTPAPAAWWELSPEYNNAKDSQFRDDGDDYSFANYAGDVRLGISSMSSTINFLKDSLVFKVPVYLIQGAEDIQTPAVINREYFKKINSPEKKFIVLPKADHGFNQSVIDMQYKLLTQYITPLIKKN